MRLDRTVLHLRQGLRIFRQAWRDAGEDGESLDILFVSIDEDEKFILERESNIFVEDVDMYQLTIEDLLADDWRIEQDTTTGIKKSSFQRLVGSFRMPDVFVSGRQMAGALN